MSAHMYSGWRPEKQGWLFGLSGGQLVGILIVWAYPALGLFLGKLSVVIMGGVIALIVSVLIMWRPGGRTLFGWLIASGVWSWSDKKRYNEFQSRLSAGLDQDPTQPDLPGVLGRLVFYEGPMLANLSRLGLIHDPIERTWTVVARTHNQGIALETDTTINARVSGHAELLEEVGGDPHVLRVVEYVRTVPDDGTEARHWQEENLDPSAPAGPLETVKLLRYAAATQALRQETFMALVIDERKAARAASAAGGGLEGYGKVIQRKLHGFASVLTSCGFVDHEWLDVTKIGDAISEGFSPLDPVDRAISKLTNDDDVDEFTDLSAVGPASAQALRGCLLHDGSISVSFRVALPHNQMPLDALTQMMMPAVAGERRSIALHFEGIEASQADRAVANEIYKSEVAMDAKVQRKFRTSRKEVKSLEEAHRQESQLAYGATLMRAAVVLTVTVPTNVSIDDACAAAESSARKARMGLQRLWMAQDAGFYAGALPIGVGLPRIRGGRA